MAIKHDYKNMSEEQIKELAQHYASQNGYEVMEVVKLKSPADGYLRYVMGYNESKKEYASWMLNCEMGGLHYGHYYGHFFDEYEGQTTKEEAFVMCQEDFYTRALIK